MSCSYDRALQVSNSLYTGVDHEETIQTLETFEMWLYRISWSSWTEHISRRNRRELTNIVEITKVQYLEHPMKNNWKYSSLQVIMQGKVKGKRKRERRRIFWLHNLRRHRPNSSEKLTKNENCQDRRKHRPNSSE